MPKQKELKTAIGTLAELNKKAEAEIPEAVSVPSPISVGKVEQLTFADGTPAPGRTQAGEALARIYNNLREETEQNTIRILQELKELKERMDTIESVLTKLVIHSQNKVSQENTPEEEPAKELTSASNVVELVKTGLNSLKEQGHNRVKFSVIMENLVNSGIVVPNVEEFKKVLRTTSGFKFFPFENSFSYTEESVG